MLYAVPSQISLKRKITSKSCGLQTSFPVAKLCTALLKMLDPVGTCVFDLRRKTLLYATTLYVSQVYQELIVRKHLDTAGIGPDVLQAVAFSLFSAESNLVTASLPLIGTIH